jgi:hypothetical protein
VICDDSMKTVKAFSRGEKVLKIPGKMANNRLFLKVQPNPARSEIPLQSRGGLFVYTYIYMYVYNTHKLYKAEKDYTNPKMTRASTYRIFLVVQS